MIDFNTAPLSAKEVAAIVFGGCLLMALLLAGGAAFLAWVPGPWLEVVP